MLNKKSAVLVALATVLAAVACTPAMAAYPDKPITLVVPFSPGGANDAVARIVARAAESSLGVTVVIDNKPGAGGTIGSEAVAKAQPDGYTLLLASAAHAINTLVYAKLPYDPIKDFTPVAQLTEAPYVAVVRSAFPAKNLAELIDMARKSPGRYTFASSGNGSAPHLAGALMASMAGVSMQHVPYKGGGPALVDVMRGDVTMYFSSLSGALPNLKSGNLRALAVTTAHRTKALGDVPTVAEAAVPGYELSGWYGILAPAGTPDSVVQTLNGALNKALQNPAVANQLATEGETAIGGSPQVLADLIKNDMAKYTKLGKLVKVD